MSLVVQNAYRYPLSDQKRVHTRLMFNCEKITTGLAEINAVELSKRLHDVDVSEWALRLNAMMHPKLPCSLGEAQLAHYASCGDKDLYVRRFMYEYHRFINAYPSTWPFLDTVITWAYTWDTNYGYVALFLPLGVSSTEMVSELNGIVEPYSYNGRVGETDHPSEPPEKVSDTWDALVGCSSIAHAGATASLGGYELLKAFGLA